MAKNEKSKNILSTVGDFLSTFIVAVVAILAVFFVFVRVMDWHMFSVDSGSMEPDFPVNTLIIVQNTNPENIKEGDVITFILNEEGTLVTHRVTGIDSVNKTFTTKGDANNIEDASPVYWDNIVGKVIFSVPGMGKPLRVITDENNRPVFIGIIVLLFAVSLFWDFYGRKKNKKKKNTEEISEEEPSET